MAEVFQVKAKEIKEVISRAKLVVTTNKTANTDALKRVRDFFDKKEIGKTNANLMNSRLECVYRVLSAPEGSAESEGISGAIKEIKSLLNGMAEAGMLDEINAGVRRLSTDKFSYLAGLVMEGNIKTIEKDTASSLNNILKDIAVAMADLGKIAIADDARKLITDSAVREECIAGMLKSIAIFLDNKIERLFREAGRS